MIIEKSNKEPYKHTIDNTTVGKVYQSLMSGEYYYIARGIKGERVAIRLGTDTVVSLEKHAELVVVSVKLVVEN